MIPTGPLMKRRVRFVSLIVVLASALVFGFFYQRYSSRRAREATLKFDLLTMREAIDNYTLDKQQPPQSLQALVNGHYLKEIPTDPFTRKKDWVPQFDDVVLSPEQLSTGMVDVHSASSQVSSNGIPYNEW
jgi:general secretion pathway protein G